MVSLTDVFIFVVFLWFIYFFLSLSLSLNHLLAESASGLRDMLDFTFRLHGLFVRFVVVVVAANL